MHKFHSPEKDQAKPDTPGTIGSCRREAVPDGPYKGVRALSPAPTRSVRERAGMLALILFGDAEPQAGQDLADEGL